MKKQGKVVWAGIRGRQYRTMFMGPSSRLEARKGKRVQGVPVVPLALSVVQQEERRLLTPCAYALSPEVPENSKVIGGGDYVGELERERKKRNKTGLSA